MNKKKNPEIPDLSKIIDLLNQSLEVEYSFIVNYPRIASAIKDENAKNMMIKLGEDSIHHADVVANVITELGGVPNWSFQLLGAIANLPDILQKQLLKEEFALKLHGQTAELASNPETKDKLKRLGEAEEWHIRAVKEILSSLDQI